MFNMSQFQNSMDSFIRENDKSLRRIFSGKIKGNFLTAIKNSVRQMLGPDIFRYYDMQITNEKLVSTGFEEPDFDICHHIVGIHRSNLIFNTEEERLKKEKSEDYKNTLVNDVITNIKLRQYGSVFFQKQVVSRGENFNYYPIPYDLFVLCVRMNDLLSKCNDNVYISLIAAIVNKGLAALTLLEGNFFDCAYPICRGITELYLKLLILLDNPNTVEHFLKFNEYDLLKSCCEQKYSTEFNNAYNNRINKNHKSKSEFLHFGWLDTIDDYHSDNIRPYSIGGIISYLKTKCDQEEQINTFDEIETLYKMCHGYTHGSVVRSKYPLLHYFEISLMLYYTIYHTYIILCDYLKVDTVINDIDILKKIAKDVAQLYTQYYARSTENFELYDKLNKL
ncbi:MAG: hypothetical protein HDT32_03520 [Clostridiales bacterium]|nr:hypothetical protein [Clostridiales bacterium]